MEESLATDASIDQLQREAIQGKLQLPTIVRPNGVARESTYFTNRWVAHGDLQIPLEPTYLNRKWRDVLQPLCFIRLKKVSLLEVRLLNYVATSFASANIADDISHGFLRQHSDIVNGRSWNAFWDHSSCESIANETIWQTLQRHSSLIYPSSKTREWVLLVKQADVGPEGFPEVGSPMFRQFDLIRDPGAANLAGAGLGAAAAAAETDEDEAAAKRRIFAGGALTKTAEKVILRFLNSEEEILFRIKGGQTRPITSSSLLIKAEKWWKDPINTADVLQPSIRQLELLYTKAKAVGKLTAIKVAAVALDAPAEMAPSAVLAHGAAFLVAPRILITCFHALYDVKHQTYFSDTFECKFTLLNDLVVTFQHQHILYSPLAPGGNFVNIGYDVAMVELPDDAQWKAVDGALDPANYIRFFSAQSRGLLDCAVLRTENQQSIFILGHPAPASAVGPSSTRPYDHLTITLRDNAIMNFINWDILYQNTTFGGMSGGPGLLADGTLAAIHRRAGPPTSNLPKKEREAAHFGMQRTSYCNVGLRTELFVLDEFGKPPFVSTAAEDDFGPIEIGSVLKEGYRLMQMMHAFYEKLDGDREVAAAERPAAASAIPARVRDNQVLDQQVQAQHAALQLVADVLIRAEGCEGIREYLSLELAKAGTKQ